MDKVSLDAISKLHPSIRQEVTDIINKANARLTGRSQVRITQGLRTNKEQDALYAKGRTLPGQKVTKAKGGQSIHNYGLAVDFCLILDGKSASWSLTEDYDGDKKADWMEVVEEFKKAGWEWGGNWVSFKDYPHFQKAYVNVKGKLIKTDYKNLINLPKDSAGYIIL